MPHSQTSQPLRFGPFEEARGTYTIGGKKVGRSTMYRLIAAGKLRTHGESASTRKDRRWLPRPDVCFEDLESYVNSRQARPEGGELVTIREAAKMLNRSVGGMRNCVNREGIGAIYDTFPAARDFSARRGKLIERKDVKGLAKRRAELPARSVEHVDENGRLWLSGALAWERYRLEAMNLLTNSRRLKSSWYLDGREYSWLPLPPAGRRRRLGYKWMPNRGRGQKRLCVYLDADLQIIHDRAAGLITAEQARVRAANGTPATPFAPPGKAKTVKSKPPRRRRGRPVGTIDHAAKKRNEKMVEAKRSGRFPSTAKLAKAFKVSRAHASKILRAAQCED